METNRMQGLVDEIIARALPLIHVEREAEHLDTREAYDAFRERHTDLNRQVEGSKNPLVLRSAL